MSQNAVNKAITEKTAEAARSEERFLMAQRAGRVGIWDWNIAEDDAYWSETTWELFGQTPQDRAPDREAWESHLHPDDRQRAWDHLHAAVASEETNYRDEFRIVTADDKIRWVESTAQISRNAEGRATRLLGVYIDVTDRKAEEKRLKLLADIGEAIRTTANDTELLHRVATRVGEYFSAQRCLFNEIDLENDLETVHRDYFNGVDSVAGSHRLSGYSSITSADMAAGKTVVNHDSKADPRTAGQYRDVYEPSRERAYVAVPLMRDRKWVASLWISCDSPHEWSDADVRLLEMSAERAWFGVEKARNEDAMRASEERFSRFMQHLPGLAWIKDLDGRYVYANDAAFGAFGRERDELYGRTDAEVFPPPTAELFVNNDRRVLKEKAGIQRIETLTQPDGELHHSVVSKFPIFDEHGEATLVGGMAIDITEQRRAEIALRAKEKELQMLADTTPLVLVRCGRDLRYKFINKAGAALFDMEPEEVVGQRIPDLMGDEAWSRIESQIDKVLRGEIVEYDAELPYPTGTHWMRVNYVPERDGSGEVIGWIASIMDITEVRNANALVQRDLADMIRLRELGAMFATGADIQTLYDRIVDTAVKLAGGDAGTLQLYDRSKHLEVIASRGFEQKFIERFSRVDAKPHTSWGRALQTGESVLQDYDVPPDDDPDGSLHAHLEAGFRTAQSVPLISRRGGAIGMLTTHWHEQRRPTEREIGFMELLARQAADLISRKIYEDRLRESDERLRMAQRAGGVGIWDWNIAEGRTYWSETTWDFYGEPPNSAEPNEEFWTVHLHPEDRERVKQNLIDTVISKSNNYRDEFRILRRDGTILWIEANAGITRDPDGHAARVFGVNIDITERRLAEDRIRASAQQLRLVTDAMPALISYVDKRERYRFANQTYQEWFGVEPADVIGKKVREIFGEEIYSIVRDRIRTTLEGEDVSFETEIQYPQGPRRHVHVSYTPDIDADGKVRGYFALTTDLTELRRSQELLRSTEEKVGLMMETFTDYAILSLDSSGMIDSWNVGAKLIFGYEESEIIGQPGEIIFLPEDIAASVPEKEMRTAREKGRAQDERWHLRKDGTRFYASGVMMPLYLGQTLTGYAKIASDLTERQRQQEELERAHGELELRVAERTRELAESNRALIEEAKARSAAEAERIQLLHRLVTSQEMERRRIARDIHDQLGQRLTGLRLKLESLKSVVGKDADVAARVRRLQEISERLDSEVSFLAWELRPTVLDDLGLVEALRTYVKEWMRHTETDADFQAIKVGRERFDVNVETHLYRIAQEALNNINKHAKAENVTVMLEKRKRELLLIVEDDGKGFDPAKLPRPRKSGRGLGLIGMRERSALIGGELDIESSENGTTIYVRVPVFES
ncbi:MAG TPA: PAS domain S-box protein [Pyrinomonadaceae bacterium]